MISVNTYNLNGEIVGKTELPSEIFGLKMNPDLVKQVVVAQMANQRKISAHTKGRAEVRGGGRKPWRQKGTGRARHGSIRSPLWRGGGITFGPTKEKIYKKKINKKMKRKALLMVLSSKVKDKELIIVEVLKLAEAKTKKIAEVLKKLISESVNQLIRDEKKMSVLIATGDKKVIRASRNIAKVKTIRPDSLNVLDLLKFKYLLMPKKAIGVIERTYGRAK